MKQQFKFLILLLSLALCACGPKLNSLSATSEPNTTEYPGSRSAAAASLDIIRTLYQEGQHNEVILKASQAIGRADTKANLSEIYTILGDTYIALGSPVDAILFYTIALQKSGHADVQPIQVKIETLISQLRKEDIMTLLMTDEEVPKDRLLYQLGLNAYNKENYEEAKKFFLKYIKTYPLYEKTIQAKNLIDEIHQRTVFNPRTIGCLLPLSGPYKIFGKRALRAIDLALDQYNSDLDKSNFRIIVKDTRSNPDQTLEALRDLDEERAALIIGPIVTSEAAARESQKRSIPIITLTQKAGIAEIGDYIFRNFLTPEMQIEAIVPFAIEKLGIERFAILYPDENYGHTFMKAFRDKVMNYGAEISGIESYHPDQTDFAEPISKLAKIELKDWRSKSRNRRHKRFEVAVDFDAIFIPDSAEKTSLIAPQLAFYDVDDVLLLGTNLWHSNGLIKEAGKYVQFALMADGYYADTPKKKVGAFITAFEEQYGETPGIVEAFAYDTAMIAFQTADNSTIRSRRDLKNELKNLYQFDGITGVTSFKENGDAEKKLYLLQIDGDKFVELNSF